MCKSMQRDFEEQSSPGLEKVFESLLARGYTRESLRGTDPGILRASSDSHLSHFYLLLRKVISGLSPAPRI